MKAALQDRPTCSIIREVVLITHGWSDITKEADRERVKALLAELERRHA